MYRTIRFREWVKSGENPLAKYLKQAYLFCRHVSMPAPKPVWSIVYWVYHVIHNTVHGALRIIFWTPLFKSQLQTVGNALYLYGGLPFITGPLNIKMGDQCRISGKTTFTGRAASKITPELILGSNIDVGWMCTIAVGSRIVIGDNVRIAGQCFMAGYPGHPIDAGDRAAGLPDEDGQCGEIILEDDVWIATGVSIKGGVRVGRGTVVAAGSVVTKDLPPFVLAAGNPAKIIKHLNRGGDQ